MLLQGQGTTRAVRRRTNPKARLCACLRAHEVWIEQSKALLRPGGVLAVLSPFTWLEKFVPQDNWLGGYRANSEVLRPGRFDGFQWTLRKTSAFELEEPQSAEW